jgi:predicted DNA-binding transcriptional regulator YafY
MPFALVLRVAPAAHRRTWTAEGTVLEEEPDGGLLVRIDTESAQAAVAYALSLGADATVLDPPEVREAVAAAARSIVRLYAARAQAGGGRREAEAGRPRPPSVFRLPKSE